MPKTDEELKARLEARVRAVIAEVLSQQGELGAVTLSDIEQSVRQAGQAFEQVLTDELVQEQSQALELTWPLCPQCGQKMKAKGKRARRLVTQTGEVTLVREYYHCSTCQVGLFPPR